MNIKYQNIDTVVGSTLTFVSPVKFLKAGMQIKNMQSSTTTTIASVVSPLVITLTSATGFSNGTSVQIEGDTWDGDSLASYIPNWVVSDDLREFLNVFSTEIQSQWLSICRFTGLLDPDRCPANLLVTLANSYGIFIDADDSEFVQRTVIKTSQYGYKFKGSRNGITAAFNSLGYDITIREYFCGKYIGTIDTVVGETITFNVGVEVPALVGAFRVLDAVCLADGPGSRTPATHPAQWRTIKNVLTPLEYELEAGFGSAFSPGDDIVVFAYNQTRMATTADWEDNVANEFPLQSSFFEIILQDKRSPTQDITPVILEKLTAYLKLFKSSHARLRGGSGIREELVYLASFRGNLDVEERGVLAEIPTPESVEFEYWSTDPYAINLDDGHILDEGHILDTETFLTTTWETEYDSEEYNNTESISLAENYSIT